MAANKYFGLVGNKLKEIFASNTSAANAIGAMDATGRFDISMMPVGVGAEVVVCPAFEALVAGDFVNLFLSGGVIKAQKASAVNNTKPAKGFILTSQPTPGANCTVFLISNINTAVSGLAIGTEYFLSSTVPGGFTDNTATILATNGAILQSLGIATAVDKLPFDNIQTLEITV